MHQSPPALPADSLLAAIDALLLAVERYGQDVVPDSLGAPGYPTAVEWEQVQTLRARVLGLTLAAGLPAPPALEHAGLPVYTAIPWQRPQPPGYGCAYQTARRGNSAARAQWWVDVRAWRCTVATWAAAHAADLAASPPARPTTLAERLQCDVATQTVTLDGKKHRVGDPRAFAIYQALAESCPQPLPRARLQERVSGCQGDKKVRQLLDELPPALRATIYSGYRGYWLKLGAPPRRRRPRQS